MIREILDFAEANDRFTSSDFKEKHPGINAANVTTTLKRLTELGKLVRYPVIKEGSQRPVFEYRLASKMPVFVPGDIIMRESRGEC